VGVRRIVNAAAPFTAPTVTALKSFIVAFAEAIWHVMVVHYYLYYLVTATVYHGA
jgi:hypothetical protein